MIELLNRYFIPVFTSNEDYRDNGAAPPEERAELQRIFQEGYAKKLSVGTVHAYVIGPDGHLLSSLHTVEAAKPAKLTEVLESAVRTFKTVPGDPVVKPCPPSPAACAPGSLRLYLTARYLEKRGDDYALTEDPGGGWAATPGTDWVCVPRAEWNALVPASGSRVGSTWKLPSEMASRLMKHFYPPTENNDLAKNKPEIKELTATEVEKKGSRHTIRIDGRLKMQHDFYHKPDGRYVDADLVGYAVVDTREKAVMSFNLVTDTARYYSADGKYSQPFGVAVRLVP